MEIHIEIPTSQIAAANRLVDGWKWMAADLSKPFKRFAAYYDGVVMRTFKAGGRPPGSWAPLAAYTLAIRKWRGKHFDPKGILQDTGALHMSFTSRVEAQGMQYGTSVPYSAKHQEGGPATMNAKFIKARNGKALKFTVNGQTFFRKYVFQPEKQVQIPARPMITWLPEDEAKLEQIIEEYFKEKAGELGASGIYR
ncbi:MAG TPA: phage virion morphogenesis protein [Candidatus Krumholzibacteriaceae bacterium]